MLLSLRSTTLLEHQPQVSTTIPISWLTRFLATSWVISFALRQR